MAVDDDPAAVGEVDLQDLVADPFEVEIGNAAFKGSFDPGQDRFGVGVEIVLFHVCYHPHFAVANYVVIPCAGHTGLRLARRLWQSRRIGAAAETAGGAGGSRTRHASFSTRRRAHDGRQPHTPGF